jgi:hypothetical protein
VAEKIRTEADYFARNAERMRYPKFHRQHLFVGSGVIGAGGKTVIASRRKRSGMFWTVRSQPDPGTALLLSLKITGRAAGQLLLPDSNFYVAHPPILCQAIDTFQVAPTTATVVGVGYGGIEPRRLEPPPS